MSEDKHKFGNKYSDEDFLAAIPGRKMITSVGISRKVGCSHQTASTWLEKLATAGLITRVEIVDGHDVVWQKVA